VLERKTCKDWRRSDKSRAVEVLCADIRLEETPCAMRISIALTIAAIVPPMTAAASEEVSRELSGVRGSPQRGFP